MRFETAFYRGWSLFHNKSHIDLWDLFFIMNHEDIANYANGNTAYVFGKNIDEVVRFLEESSRVIFKWFSEK